MIRGLWSAVGGMMSRELKQDVITHNLANAGTAGFRRRTVAFHSETPSFGDALQNAAGSNIPAASAAIPYAQEFKDTAPGAFQQTDNQLNVAIEGDGYFMVEDRGMRSLTKNGAFVVGSDGTLMTSSGESVLGERGTIKVSGSSDIQIDPRGNVIADGQTVDTLKVVSSSGTPIDSPVVRQGELEMSNVNPVIEMVDLISNLRAYETNQKVVQSIDHTLDKLINEAGR